MIRLSLEFYKTGVWGGCMPDLGWEQFGGEVKPAVGGISYRLLEGRRFMQEAWPYRNLWGNTVGWTLFARFR